MSTSFDISVIVPTYNSAKNLGTFFESLLIELNAECLFEIIVNDDPRTSDETLVQITKYKSLGLEIIYLSNNTGMAAARSNGADHARSDVLLHLDSDMQVTPGLLQECVAAVAYGNADALVIPEESIGTNLWGKCRWLEKRIYSGVDEIESLRCLRHDLYRKVGKHSDTLTFSEDKDLDLRVRAAGAKVKRSKRYLLHIEGNPTLSSIFQKKRAYASSAAAYSAVHKEAFAQQVSLVSRLRILVAKPRLILRHPILFACLLLIGATEYAALFASRKSNSASDVK